MVGFLLDWLIEEVECIYGVLCWGGGYFKIGDNGNVYVVLNFLDLFVCIDFKVVIDEIL